MGKSWIQIKLGFFNIENTMKVESHDALEYLTGSQVNGIGA